MVQWLAFGMSSMLGALAVAAWLDETDAHFLEDAAGSREEFIK